MLVFGADFPYLTVYDIRNFRREYFNSLHVFKPEIPRLFYIESNTGAEHWINQHHNSEKKKTATTENLKADYEYKREISNVQAFFIVMSCLYVSVVCLGCKSV